MSRINGKLVRERTQRRKNTCTADNDRLSRLIYLIECERSVFTLIVARAFVDDRMDDGMS